MELPYTVPEGAYYGYPPAADEEQPPKMGKAINTALYKAIFGEEPLPNETYQAVAKLEHGNCILFIIYQRALGQNNGNEIRSYSLHTFSKTGKKITTRTGSAIYEYADFSIYGVTTIDGQLTYGTEDWNKDDLLYITTTEVDKRAQYGDYNQVKVNTTTTFETIEQDGTIVDVTTYIEED